MAQAKILYNIVISSEIWFLQPAVICTHSWLQTGDIVYFEDKELISSSALLTTVRAGTNILTTRSDAWHGYLGLWYVKPSFERGNFEVSGTKIPGLEIEPYTEITLSFQTESATRFIFGVELMGSFSDTRRFGGNLTLQF